MKTCPILAMACLIGAGVIWVAGKGIKEKRDEVQRLPVVRRLVETERREEHRTAEQKARACAPQAPAQRREVRVVRILVTAYCLCDICCEKWACLPRRKTSIGDDAKVYDGVAADPKLLPYRTKLEIPEIGIKEVDDTGGAMRQDAKRGITHIDVRMASHSAARQWGVRWLEVKVLK